MGLFIDTSETVPFEVEGTTFRIRVLTARQRLRASVAAMRVGKIIEVLDTGEVDEDGGAVYAAPSPEQALEIQEAQFEILCIGLDGWGKKTATPELIDTISQRAWTPLCNRIMEANRVEEADSKN